MINDIFKGVGIEICFNKEEDFLIVKETLTRIGISSKKEKTLYQSCHIFHKQGRYRIVHFKELFTLDGKSSNLSENDIQRRNAITKLLEDWGLIKIINTKPFEPCDIAPVQQIKILSSKDAKTWNLIPKYNIGKKIGV